MIVYVFNRILLMIFIILAASIAVFSIMYLIPGDPAEIIARQVYGPEASGMTIEVLREDLGLNDPIYIQYFRWLVNSIKGDFGLSYMSGRPVTYEIAARLPATLQLAAGSMFLSLLIAVPLGMAAALKHHTFIDDIIGRQMC